MRGFATVAMPETFMGRADKILEVRAADGHVVPAVLTTRGSDRLILMSHGITGDRDEEGAHSDFAEECLKLGFDSIRFDFRGHGQSRMPSRHATICGRILDFMAVIRHARNLDYKQTFHVATSFGASITLLSAKRFSMEDFSAVVFWNPVIDYEHTFVNPTVEWARGFFTGTAGRPGFRRRDPGSENKYRPRSGDGHGTAQPAASGN